jgi:hypothetical protein
MSNQQDAFDLAASYFEMARTARSEGKRESYEEMGYYTLLAQARGEPEPECWPDGSAKSQGVFTAHLESRSTIRYAQKTGPKPANIQTRYQQDAAKAAIYDLRGVS